MAFRSKSKSERGEVELLRGLVKLANQLQSSRELDAIVRVIATALGETFGFREATMYLVDEDGALFRARATVGEFPEYDQELFNRPVPRHIWDQLFRSATRSGRPTSSITTPMPGLRNSSTTCRRWTWGAAAQANGTRTTICSCRSSTRTVTSWACSTCTTPRTGRCPRCSS